MSKKEFIAAIATEAGVTNKAANSVLNALAEVATNEMFNGNEVTLPGIGKLYPAERAARTGRNPRNGDPVAIAASVTPKFEASKVLKDALNK